AFLKPATVVDERLDRHQITFPVLRLAEEALKPVPLTGIGKVGGPPMGTQQHPFGHAGAPEFQRFAEDGDLQSLRKEMSGRRQAVRTGTHNDRVVYDPHEKFFLKRDSLFRMASRVKSVVALTAGRGSFQSMYS